MGHLFRSLIPHIYSKLLPVKSQLKSYSEPLAFLLLLMLVLLDRWLSLAAFSFQFVDSDQTVMWYAAKEFAAGNFHEPRFYGQNYNSMLEALLAAPFTPYFISLPLVSSLLTLLPYTLFAALAFRKGLHYQSLLILVIPLLLPLEYAFITSMPRGFVTGIAVAAMGGLTLFFPNRKWTFVVLGFSSILGLSLNPNAILLVAPLMLYCWLQQLRNKAFYLFLAGGALLPLLMHLGSNWFYHSHPAYNIHLLQPLAFSIKTFLLGLQSLTTFFSAIAPWGPLVFIFLAFFAALHYRDANRAAMWAVVLAFIGTLAALGINKVHDGDGTIFFHSSRMFLALPVLVALFTLLFQKINQWVLVLVLFLGMGSFVMKHYQLADKTQTITQPQLFDDSILQITSVDQLNLKCAELKQLMVTYEADLLVGVYDWKTDSARYNVEFLNLYACGCPALDAHFPATLQPAHERRTWRLYEESDRVHNNLLLIGGDHVLTASINDNLTAIATAPPLFIYHNTQRLPTFSILDLLGVPVRPH